MNHFWRLSNRIALWRTKIRVLYPAMNSHKAQRFSCLLGLQQTKHKTHGKRVRLNGCGYEQVLEILYDTSSIAFYVVLSKTQFEFL